MIRGNRTDYRTQAWKNGLGTTSEIGIYPPEKDFTIDSFFWRLSTHCIQNNCYFSLFPVRPLSFLMKIMQLLN
ncbi:unnamed protein product [Cunninghamella echinulata]